MVRRAPPAWACASARSRTLTLELSEPEDQGANSAALQVSDSACSVLLIGAAGCVYAAAARGRRGLGRHLRRDLVGDRGVAAAGALLASRIGRPTIGAPDARAAPASALLTSRAPLARPRRDTPTTHPGMSCGDLA